MQGLDIAIAGSGIAGLAAALLLHRQGHRVTLYERFDAPRPVGSGLMIQPTGLAVLAQLGLAEQVVAQGAPVDALLGLNTEGEAVLEASYADLGLLHAFGLGVHRASLFDALYSAVQASGVRLLTAHEVTSSDLGPQGRLLDFADGSQSAPHDFVIDAAGLGSPLVPRAPRYLPYGALWTTVDWPGEPFQPRLLEQRYFRARQMVGLLPTGGGKAAFFWSLKGDDHAGWLARGMDDWRGQVCRLWPACEAVVASLAEPEQLTFARYAHRTTRAPVGERIVHLGDAWHAASPQLGQGANMALLDAWALARALAGASDVAAAGLARFVALRQGHVRLYQAMTWAFTPPFQSDSVWPAMFRDLLMAPGSRLGPFPRVKAQVLSGLFGGPLERLGLAAPDYSALSASASTISARACSLPQS